MAINPTRPLILAVTDLHKNTDQMRWVIEQKFDLLLIAGDLLDFGEGRTEVSEWIMSIGRPLAIASGNHDCMGSGLDWLYDLRGPERVIDEVGTLNGLPICALPWRYDQGDWIDNSAETCKRVSKSTKPWVLLAHHIPPDEYQGEEDRWRALNFESHLSPAITVTGHVHEIPSLSGGWVNPGRNPFQKPNHAWFDMGRRTGFLNVFHSQGKSVDEFVF